MTTKERIEAVIADWPETETRSVQVGADEIARVLVDQDVAAGQYEGCSSELESAYTDYHDAATRFLASRSGREGSPRAEDH